MYHYPTVDKRERWSLEGRLVLFMSWQFSSAWSESSNMPGFFHFVLSSFPRIVQEASFGSKPRIGMICGIPRSSSGRRDKIDIWDVFSMLGVALAMQEKDGRRELN